MSVPRQTRHIVELDGLRGLAVLLVVLFHLNPIIYADLFSVFYDQIKLTKVGVSLFFILSGFLITRIISEKPMNSAALKIFLLKRFWRIFPLYYLFLFVIFCIYPGSYILSALTYTYNYWSVFNETHAPIGHLWSLAVEEHFYLLWPFVIILFRNHILPAAVSMMLLSLILMGLTPIFFETKSIVKDMMIQGTHAQMFMLSLGCSFAVFEKQNIHFKNYSVGILLLTFATVFMLTDIEEILKTQKYLLRNLNYTLFATGLFFLAFNEQTIKPSSSLGSFFRHSVLTFLGKISYGWYLIHLPVFAGFDVLPDGSPNSLFVRALFAIAVSLCLAYLSYKYFEAPLQKWGRSKI